MYQKKVKIGCFWEANAIKYCRFSFLSFFLILLFIVPCHSQQSPQVPLQEALLELAKSKRLSIVFSTQNIPDKLVDIREKGKSVKQRLETLLKDTELYFELKDNQILLYRKNQLFGYIE